MDIQEKQEAPPVAFDAHDARRQALAALGSSKSDDVVGTELARLLGLALDEVDRLNAAHVETIDLRVVPEGAAALRDASTEIERLKAWAVKGWEIVRREAEERGDTARADAAFSSLTSIELGDPGPGADS